MLMTGDVLDQSPDRPLATEPLERRRTPQKLRADYLEVPDTLHEMRIISFRRPPRILPRCQHVGHAGLISSASRVTVLTFCSIKRPEDLHWRETFRPPARIYPRYHKRRRMTDEKGCLHDAKSRYKLRVVFETGFEDKTGFEIIFAWEGR